MFFNNNKTKKKTFFLREFQVYIELKRKINQIKLVNSKSYQSIFTKPEKKKVLNQFLCYKSFEFIIKSERI